MKKPITLRATAASEGLELNWRSVEKPTAWRSITYTFRYITAWWVSEMIASRRSAHPQRSQWRRQRKHVRRPHMSGNTVR